ncbi:MAG: GTP 3',8-cyclase MoaA [Cyanobacteria bacterium J06633_8]
MNQVDYLRISLIDRCNFRCNYCVPEGEKLDYLLQQELLSYQELLILLKEVFIPIGFTKFRLTGGEPLIRPGIVDFVGNVASLAGCDDLAMTTNGFLLDKLAKPLYDAGLRRINISLDSLNPEIFDKMIGNRGKSRWQQTWQGIQTAYEVGFNPLKLNVVVIRGINDSEILDLAALTIERNWHVRFIEFMPIGNDTLFGERTWIPSEELRQSISQKFGLIESNIKGNGPADVFQIPGAKGTLGFISQMSECFCDKCNRIRLSADGWLRPCLLNETGQINLKDGLRNGVDVYQLQEQVRDLLFLKEEINFKERDRGTVGAYGRTMSQIGG